jgi:hypothetical protein
MTQLRKQVSKTFKKISEYNPPKGYKEKLRRHNMLVAAKKKMDEQDPPMMGNPGVVKTYEDARENAMLNRNVPTLKHGGMCRGSGIAVKGKKFQGVF